MDGASGKRVFVRKARRQKSVLALSRQRRVSLCETLDRVLNKGAVVAGDVIISVAGIDLVYVGVNLVVASHDTMRAWSEAGAEAGAGAGADAEAGAGAGAGA
ncbi:MAG: gas vesicle protein [Deltaproteobacteria bacterium]|nr:gas vesicle protein [Deltaproteobacteria bacterium]